MKQIIAYLAVYAFGGLAYGTMELAYRGRTHWTMLLVGGTCVLLLYIIAAKSDAPIWRKCVVGGAVITTVEFVSGIIINIVLGLGVWDYTALRFDLFGQICLQFTLWWILLSIPAVWILRLIDARVFRKGGVVYESADRY